MNRWLVVTLIIVSLMLFATPVAAQLPDPGSVLFASDGEMHYRILGGDVSALCDSGGLQLTLPVEDTGRRLEMRPRFAPYGDISPASAVTRTTKVVMTTHPLRLTFEGAARIVPQPFGPLATRLNVYPSADTTTWRTDLPTWQGIRYVDLYPGVDLEIIGVEGQVMWRLVCRAACDEAVIARAMRVDGGAERRADGTWHVASAEGTYTLAPPTRTLAPLLARTPDAAPAPQALLDNPSALLGGTFVGGSEDDDVMAVEVGRDGTVYVAGNTTSTDDGFGGAFFVAAYDADLRTRRFLTLLGGVPEFDGLSDMTIDASDNLYVVGTTHARDFPVTPGAFDTVLNDGGTETCPVGWQHLPCPDAFVARLDAQGHLSYATYIGGAKLFLPGWGENDGGDDYGYAVAVDAQGHIYVVGVTDSQDFPTTAGAYDRTFSYEAVGLNPDIFVVKLRPGGEGAADLRYGTYMGMGFVYSGHGVAVDEAGLIYVVGDVNVSRNYLLPSDVIFPQTPNAYPHTSQCLASECADIVFFILDPAGRGSADLRYSTFFGGSTPGVDVSFEIEYGKAIALGRDGSVYILGNTNTEDFPTTTGSLIPRPLPGFEEAAVIMRLVPASQGEADLRYSTYFGGEDTTRGSKIVAWGDGTVYVTGDTRTYNLPTTADALRRTLNFLDAFIVHLTPQGQGMDDLLYGSYVGGTTYGYDKGVGLATGDGETVYVVGYTDDARFPIPADGYDTHHGGQFEGYVLRLRVGHSTIGGRITDADGNPLAGVTVTANGEYRATTGADGTYTLDGLPAGTYVLTPGSGYFWEPVQRAVTVPPDATGQDFVGRTIEKAAATRPYQGTLRLGSAITYTLRLIFPDAASRTFYDAVPTHTSYITGTLTAPGDVHYDAVTGAIGGTFTPVPGVPLTVTFAVRVGITGTPQASPLIINRACVRPVGSGMDACTWSNVVRTFTYMHRLYLPLILR